MSTRIESATTLGISERTLRRYLSEFSGFFSSDRDLSAFDLELLRLIHSSKKTGQNTGQEIRDQLLSTIRHANSGQDNLAVLTSSVQNTSSSQSPSGVSAGQISLSSEQGGQNGQNPSALTREDLLAIVMPLVALVHTLRTDVHKLSAQLAPPLSLPAAAPKVTRPWQPMALPPPSPRVPPNPVSWWRAFLWPELQRAGQ